MKQPEFTEQELDVIVRALNCYWHEAKAKLDSKEPLGDIERNNLVYQESWSKIIIDKIED